ncbi:MAG: MmgE/PrpD family protein [Chloroflexi bacterium]|nr:MmgE/PrpD family protein [Chloroflexota bacterium]
MVETAPQTATITQELAEYVASLDARSLPSDVVEQTKWAVLDLLGVTVAGADLPFARTVREYYGELGGKAEATAVGVNGRLPAINAALVNGVCGHTLDMDDGHRYAGGHPGVVAIPAALAAGELAGASGADLVAATVAGYEVFIRVASLMNPAHLRRGFHTTGTVGPLAAAAAAGRVLGLDAKQLTHALGIASVQFGGLILVLHDGAPLKPLHPGKAASAGVLAAVLAQRGAEGPVAALEGDDGFVKVLSGLDDTSGLTDGLGERQVMREIYFKLHAACRHTHPALDVALDLAREHALTPAQIERVHLATYSVAYRFTGTVYEPDTVSAAKFSLPFSLALAFGRGSAGVNAFVPENLGDPELLRLARKVTIEVDPELDARYPGVRGAVLTVTTTDGRTLQASTELARGEPEVPATPEDLESKFSHNVSPWLGPTRAVELRDAVRRLESVSVTDLARLLV